MAFYITYFLFDSLTIRLDGVINFDRLPFIVTAVVLNTVEATIIANDTLLVKA